VALPDLRQSGIGLRRQFGSKTLNGAVNLRGELSQWHIGIQLPIAGEEMVIKNVAQNSAVPSQRRAETLDTATEDDMGVGIGVDLTMTRSGRRLPSRKAAVGSDRNKCASQFMVRTSLASGTSPTSVESRSPP
jgi:hypothetical protein